MRWATRKATPPLPSPQSCSSVAWQRVSPARSFALEARQASRPSDPGCADRGVAIEHRAHRPQARSSPMRDAMRCASCCRETARGRTSVVVPLEEGECRRGQGESEPAMRVATMSTSRPATMRSTWQRAPGSRGAADGAALTRQATVCGGRKRRCRTELGLGAVRRRFQIVGWRWSDGRQRRAMAKGQMSVRSRRRERRRGRRGRGQLSRCGLGAGLQQQRQRRRRWQDLGRRLQDEALGERR